MKLCGIIIGYNNSYKWKKQLWVFIDFDYQLPLFIHIHLVLLLALPKIVGGWPPLWPCGKWNLDLFCWYLGIYKCGQPPPWLSNKFENFKFSLWKIQRGDPSMSKNFLCPIFMKLKIRYPCGLRILQMKFEWNLRLKIFWHRRVPLWIFSKKSGEFSNWS